MTSYLRVLYLLFIVSGFSALIYQSVWTHYLKLILGHAAYAQSLVLIIFMGGMALGAYLISGISDRIKRPLLAYAIVEAVLGVMALTYHDFFVWFRSWLFEDVLTAMGEGSGAFYTKWLLCALTILPQSVLLGATFPLVSGAVMRAVDQVRSGYVVSILYATNSLGAVIGVLFSGFYLIETFGLNGALGFAGSANLLLAVGAALIAIKLGQGSTVKPDHEDHGERVTDANLLYAVAFGTGLASFIYEIGWIRMLGLVLGSSVQSFELMLAAFILGLACGGYVIRKIADRLSSAIRTLAYIQIFMGMFAIATLPLYIYSFNGMDLALRAITSSDEGYVVFQLVKAVLCIAVMFPAAFMAGMTLPMITNILVRRHAGESQIGKVYALNTVGGIIGVLIAVHLLMPFVGVKLVIVIGGMLDFLLGVWILRRNQWMLTPVSLGVIAFSVVVIVFASLPRFDPALLASGVYRPGVGLDIEREVYYYRDGKTASIAVKRAGTSVSLSTNGKSDGSMTAADQRPTQDEYTMRIAGIMPRVFRPDMTSGAVIGFGLGMTTDTVLASRSDF